MVMVTAKLSKQKLLLIAALLVLSLIHILKSVASYDIET